jgi:hypothetical protein
MKKLGNILGYWCNGKLICVDEPLAILDGHKMRKTEFWICKSNKKVRFQQHHSR